MKLYLCFNWAPRHEGVLGEWRYSSTHSLTSAVDGGEWSALCPGRFTPKERPPGTHWLGGWVGPRAGLDTVSRRKFPSPRQDSNPDPPIVQSVVSRYTDWAIPALLSSGQDHLYPFKMRAEIQSEYSGGERRNSVPARTEPRPPGQWSFTLLTGLSRLTTTTKMRAICEADHSPPCSAEVKNAWSYTSTPQYVFMAWCLAQGQVYLFTFNPIIAIVKQLWNTQWHGLPSANGTVGTPKPDRKRAVTGTTVRRCELCRLSYWQTEYLCC
jgi:hypothetical protein